ncbi:MAG TPA: Gfo/Idh/MocA family oxidoreductase [Chloroflexota bacterium]|nr:Gfo/Idh/MocA family oxidoreductase [Chloroflexota bacterium]
MQSQSAIDPLRIGLLGTGFVAHFHLQALQYVRHVQVAGVYSPSTERRSAFASEVDAAGLGPCRAFASLEDLVGSDDVDAIWILGPNDTRLEHMRAIAAASSRRSRPLLGVACEKPLARTLAEAQEMLRLADEVRINHGYLENQVFAPAIQRGKDIIWRRAVPATGRPYLARASEEHSGPHMPWFWQASRQGGGVLLDMMCHSVEVARFALTAPGATRDTLRLRGASANVAYLKWTQPAYVEQLRARMGAEVDYERRPAEDFARGTLQLQDEAGRDVLIEATTSWSYVGPGLRIQVELLGPEYALEISTLNSPLKVFLSRQVRGAEGEDLVEKQNAEQGLMPVIEDEAVAYGYVGEDRHMVEAFRHRARPIETFADGVGVAEILMALYRSAELGRTLEFGTEDLDSYVPPVARQ